MARLARPLRLLVLRQCSRNAPLVFGRSLPCAKKRPSEVRHPRARSRNSRALFLPAVPGGERETESREQKAQEVRAVVREAGKHGGRRRRAAQSKEDQNRSVTNVMPPPFLCPCVFPCPLRLRVPERRLRNCCGPELRGESYIETQRRGWLRDTLHSPSMPLRIVSSVNYNCITLNLSSRNLPHVCVLSQGSRLFVWYISVYQAVGRTT